jgi:glycosyltransferase involved in cell wall biosynthesis
MSKLNIFGHTSYIGTNGINAHFRHFYRELSSHCNVKVRNFTIGNTWKGLKSEPHNDESYINEVDKKLLCLQTLWTDGKRVDYPIYKKDAGSVDVNIVSDIVDHYYYYDYYNEPSIAYTVWESTKLYSKFFARLNDFQEVWVPSKWQKDCMVDQGFDHSKIQIVPAGVEDDVFFPENISFDEYYSDGRFKFIVFGRWCFRKSTKELIQTFLKTFNKNEPVDIIISVDNGHPDDKLKSTEERLKFYNLDDPRVKIIHNATRKNYIKFIKKGHVFLSCSRGEGWNLPLIEAMAAGTPSIYSNCSGQTEFATGKGHPINTVGMTESIMGDGGEYYEPDFEQLSSVMRDVYENYSTYKQKAMEESVDIRNRFSWKKIGEIGAEKVKIFAKKYNKKINENKSKIKVLYVTPHLSTGGAPQYLLKKIELLNKEHEIYCVEYNQIATLYVVQRNKIESMLGERFISLENRNKEDLLQIINDINPDVIHFEEFPETFLDINIAKQIYKKQRNYLIFETSHGIYFDRNQKIYFPDKFMFVSEYQSDLYKYNNVPHQIIPYPIEVCVPDKEKYKKELNFENGYKHIINVGLFTPGKNQGELIEYAKLLINEKIKFHFIGNQAGNFENYWAPLMKDLPSNCIIWGERDDVHKFYQAADLMVFTSVMECSPIVIREAITWQLPSLIYNLPAYKNMYNMYNSIKFLERGRFDDNLKIIKSSLNIL